MSKKIQSIALTDMVKNLGYRDYAILANKIRDIIKEKEDFNKYITEEINTFTRADGRPEKFCVTSESKIFVDNLAILMPFHSVFGKAKTGEKNSYTPLRILKSPKNRSALKDSLIEQKQKFERNLAKTQRSLTEIPMFASAVLIDSSIDIEKQSLREMINAVPNQYPLSDLKDRYSIGIWSDIISLQEDIDNQQADNTTYQRLGEKLFLIGEIDEAIVEFDRAIELNTKNGIAQATLALIYHKKLVRSKKTLHSLHAQNDYGGYILNPISSEEHWLNDSIDLTQEDVSQLHSLLIENAIDGLLNWPQHDYRPLNGNKNYVPNLNNSRFSDIEFSRAKLFFILLENISSKDYEERKTSINEIIESFLSIDENGYCFLYGYSHMNPKHDLYLLSLMSLYSTDVVIAELKKRASNIHYDFNVYKKGTLEFFSLPFVEYFYCKYIGDDSYFELMNTLISAQYEQAKIDNFQSKVTIFYARISPLLNKISNHFTNLTPYVSEEIKDLFDADFFSQEQHENEYHLSKIIKINEHFDYLNNEIQGWINLINNPLWIRYSDTSIEINYVRRITIYAALLELSVNKNIETNLTLIIQLTENKQKLISDVCVSDSPIEFILHLTDKIKENCCLSKHPAMTHSLTLLIEASIEAQERFLEQFD
ncbi:tetratricopeptide repeat protein [Shewanella ulleungensis]|uniref:Tetratricopeptide repeat protein n=1 Tax=Shewanella ulleungensis TaxID=2282699 RepID=A0ABQ2QD91_9GAMM|nr:hypothetical protein [Shewanella ulleungensis]MCL1148869.1 hypothetical protein [Shewanella ulleungensis]GGP75109.1 hypothetical protein GCM10009410_03890 [Shewanella ulleungensis]